MQPSGSVAKWDGDKLTFWGMGQGIYPVRAALAAALGIDVSKIRFINKWNGCTFGAARMAAERFYPLIAHLAKVTGRPVKVMLPKDQELAQLQIKPETITKFRVGAKKDGRIVALDHEVYVSIGDLDFGVHADGPGQRGQPARAVHVEGAPLAIDVVRVSDERAASRTVAQPLPAGNQVVLGKHDRRDGRACRHGSRRVPLDAHHAADAGDARHPYESMPTVEVLQEGAKAFGWEKRIPVAGGAPGRFKRGFGLGMSQHHGGLMGYHEGEEAFAKLAALPGANIFSTELDLAADGNVTMKIALPDSGSNAATALAALVAEMLGFTTRDHIRLMWGDSDLAPLER